MSNRGSSGAWAPAQSRRVHRVWPSRRNPDHRFEWTRSEFRQWAGALAQEHGYSVQYHGVGGGPLDEEAVHGEWRGVGPITQVAVFEAPSAHLAASAAGVVSEADLPLKPVWSTEEVYALPCHVTF